MTDVLKSAALYTVYAGVVAVAVNVIGAVVRFGGVAAGDMLQFASAALASVG